MTEAVVTDQRDTSSRSERRTRNIIVTAVMLGILLAALDQTIVSTALPTIVSDLGGGNHLSWVVTSYILAETIMTVLIGKFGDLFGRKKAFMASVVLFILGSFLSGWADSMGTLIIFRAIQGLGAGGLMVTASAVIADVVPLRERGKYQGALGAVFGVSTVVGPLLGGLFVDHLSWRWAFYVNIPLGIVVILIVAVGMTSTQNTTKPKIDYLGILLIALAATGLTLVTSWGGNQYAWGSPTIIGMAIGSIILLIAFVLVEQRAEEPMLPMRLFRSQVFSIAGVLSFVVGFLMLGSITFLPTYLQYVQGASATGSGLRMLPLVLGLLITALVSGNVISKTGRYKIFPVVGSVILTIGLFLLSLLDAHTSFLATSAYMIVFGLGLGCCMQVPTIVVQNTTDYADLGVATSGVSFLRTMGSSFGAAAFGTIYASTLPDKLTEALRAHPLPAGINPAALQSVQGLHSLPPSVKAPIVDAYAETLQSMFLIAAPIGLLSLAVAFFLKEVPLRDSSRAMASGTSGIGDSFAAPSSTDSEQELARVLTTVLGKQKTVIAAEVVTKSGLPITETQHLILMRLYRTEYKNADGKDSEIHSGEAQVSESGSGVNGGEVTADESVRGMTMQQLSVEKPIPVAKLVAEAEGLVEVGYLLETDGRYTFTEQGRTAFTRLVETWRLALLAIVADWSDKDKLTGVINRFADRIVENANNADKVGSRS